MVSTTVPGIQLLDLKPGGASFRCDILDGLTRRQKITPCKYFYDKHGSDLFERICQLDEYYVPRTEISIMEKHIAEIAELLGPNVMLIEFGCGNCTKTEFLLKEMRELAAYVPVDISREQLQCVTQEMALNHRGLDILPVCGDYTGLLELPRPQRTSERSIVYFPGSSFGNFHLKEAQRFLNRVARICRPGGGLLIGLDLKKDPAVLHRAYNDADRVTADFNMNILERINRELGGDFNLRQFEHYAFYNPKKSRIEMHLVSLKDQDVHLDGATISFATGESIWTESSYKYNLDDFALLAAASGFKVEQVWTDARRWFSVQYLVKA
jgi:dimethylhistidine N-methyltransferase